MDKNNMDILSGYMNQSAQIDTLWNIFMGIHVAVFIGLNKVARPFWAIEIIGIMIGYFIFSWLNFQALYIDYKLLAIFARGIMATLHENANKEFLELYTFMTTYQYGDRIRYNILIHLGEFLLLWFI
ncbi:hypothetical protein HQ394_09525 [Defluviicoccus vanus]|uniref:Uncharacterized protein n=2 Tax=Defluviicoccus vanus TaxID=111831 RepID=A0A7H1N1E3_9PROT|nr:hypothetical protein HQ394_09525 [Defluviicoccus vanus]